MRAGRVVVWGVALGLAAGWGWLRFRTTAGLEADLRRMGPQTEAVEARLARMEAQVAELRGLVAAEQQEFRALAARMWGLRPDAVGALSGEAVDPQHRWSRPPEVLPDWDADSPFVWIGKELLPGLPVRAFDGDGALNPEIVGILGVDPGRVEAINAALGRVLSGYREFQASQVRRLDVHPAGVAELPGEKVTVEIPSDSAKGIEARAAFAWVLEESLGSQRGALLMGMASDWLWRELGTARSEPYTLSVVRDPEGTFQVITRSGAGGTSVGGITEVEGLNPYLPAHLRGWFGALLEGEGGR